MRNTFLSRKGGKSSLLKRSILGLCIQEGERSISEISKHIGTSVPTTTKLVAELIDEGFLVDLGKQGTSGGRRPSIFGLNPDAGWFVGVDVRHTHASVVVNDFKGNVITLVDDIPFVMSEGEEGAIGIARNLREFFISKGWDFDKVLGLGISVAGRVNPETGYSSNYSGPSNTPLDKVLEDELGVKVVLENDSRAMAYGEFLSGVVKKEKNVLFVNVSWGLGMGMILDGKLYYGKSGFSGEFGHFPLLDNDVICRCGKVGCLETGASGSALVRIVQQRLSEGRASSLSAKYRRDGKVNINDIIKAINEEDMLAIEVLGELGDNIGRALAGLINLFNPELVVIGGKMAVVGDYLMFPIRASVKKRALNIAGRDTHIKFSKLGRQAAPIGVSLLSRNKVLGL